MKIAKFGILLFGIILLIIGLISYFYYYIDNPGTHWATIYYPYQNMGMILTVAGIAISLLGFFLAFFYSPKKSELAKQNV